MRAPRICFVGGVYHVVTRCNNREFYFQDDEDCRMFLKILLRAKKLYNIQVYAYCITSNHVHLLVGTPDAPNLSLFMQYLNGNFSRVYNKRHGKTGRFWGGRFYSTVIEAESQFFNTLFYIELNMVRCRAVEYPADWKWSSYQAHAMGKENPVLDFHDIYLALGCTDDERQRAYRDMADAYIQDKGFSRQPAFSAGVILGSKTFVEILVKKYGQIVEYFRNRRIFELKADCFSLRNFISVPGG